MKKQAWILTVAVSVLALCATAAMTQTAPRAPARAPAPARKPAAPPSAYQSKAFAPGFDDLMTMLVQPRHIRLYYAGQAKNWEMAAGEVRDLRQSFDRLGQTIPQYEGNDVAKAVEGFVTPSLDALDAAIAAADAAKFSTAYQQLTTGCNNCHTYMEHPFLVIKIPAGNSALSDQDFEPQVIQ